MNEKQVTIITIVCLALILLGGGGAIYYLQFVLLDEKNTDLQKVTAEVKDAETKLLEIPKLKKDIENLKVAEAEAMERIPNLDKTQYDALADLLDDLRRSAGVTVSRVSWQTPTRAQPVPGQKAAGQPATVHKVQYDLNVTGTFYQVLRYVNLLEQQKRFIGVDSFSIAKASQGATSDRTQISRRELKITVYSYTYKLPPAKPVIEGDEARTGRSTDIPD